MTDSYEPLDFNPQDLTGSSLILLPKRPRSRRDSGRRDDITRNRRVERIDTDSVDSRLSRPELLHELFEATVARLPRQVAVVCGQQQLTYAQLDARANQLARHLRSQGVSTGDLVGMWLPRSSDVYVTILAILKAGAAYVPLDPDYPADRVNYILDDCQVKALVTTSELAAGVQLTSGSLVAVDRDEAAISAESTRPLARREVTATWRDRCYVIYTSGSTGRPKGVEIEHRSACNLVRAESRIFGVKPSDRVFQGFSIAFDASVEEVWLAFFSGATLVVGTREMVQAGPALAGQLTAAGVTVLSTVPTLLAMFDQDLPTVRLLILGGEACHADLVSRWARPGRRMVNTYGPTEATVIATYADVVPDRPVTIGRPVPNYRTFILDDQMQLALPGETGELHIGGVGLARGYLGRPELTRERFIANPLASERQGAPLLYKTGDLARYNADGDIEFLGRADSQVKLRGFRIELAEIETVLMQCPAILAAAVTVREDSPGMQQLVGYVVLRQGAQLDEAAVRAQLRERLPVYMIPQLLETLNGLPTLPSGKVDRRSLPRPQVRVAAPTASAAAVVAGTADEQRILEVWQQLFAPLSVTLDSDFFLDLGGHSLLAARMVSELRSDARFAELSMLDVYQQPTIAKLAETLAQRRQQRSDEAGERSATTTDGDASLVSRSCRRLGAMAHFLCGTAQVFGLYLVLGFFALQWLAPYLTYAYLYNDDFTVLESLIGALGILLGLYPAMLVLSLAIKWLLIGRYKAGRYPLWGVYYFRWWLVGKLQSVVPVDFLAGTPLLSIYCRLMGAKVGKNVFLASDLGLFDLISIGDDTSIGSDVNLAGYTVEDGFLTLGRIDIGSRVFVGTRCVVGHSASIGDDAVLDDLSMLPIGAKIPCGQRWQGSPAQPAAALPEDSRPPLSRPSRARSIAFGLLHAVGVFLLPLFLLGAIFPGMILMNHLNLMDDYYWYLVASPAVALSFVILMSLEIAAAKWILVGRVKAGTYDRYSWFYCRKWLVDQLMDLSLDVMGPLYSSIYLAPWYRLLGAKLGRRAEISTASFSSPDLLQVDDEAFIADAVSLGAPRFDRNTMTLGTAHIGRRSFIGNSGLVAPGSSVGENCLIGCLSAPPDSAKQTSTPEGSSWLGSPAFFLPQRQATAGFSEESTYTPTRKLWIQRAVIEFIRVILPTTFFVMLTSVLFSVVVLNQDLFSLVGLLLLFPLLYVACGVTAASIVIAMKWLMMGKYRPSEQPLWSTFVWKTELLTAMHEHLADLFLVEMLTGTPFICWFFRLMGCKIGRRVYMETTNLTEFDLIEIGDEVCLNDDCTIQTHLFEDRVMKMSTIRIERGCNVGCLSLVLYDTHMGEGSTLDDLSLLMKGESLPPHTRWQGIPARSVGA